jgi:hypothetical protein
MDDQVMGTRPRAEYTRAEQRFSVLLRERLHDLVQGKRNDLWLLRRYPEEPHRLGVMALPAGGPGDELRLPVVEALVREAIGFVSPDGAGGPVSQCEAPDGGVVEYQSFSTKFPHIVLERTDRYALEGSAPVEITWRLQRVQNQRAQVQINRLLDAANLAFEFVRLVR